MRAAILKTAVKSLTAGAALCVLGAGAYYVKWCVADAKFATITPGAVYQSAASAPKDLVAACAAHGIRTVIDLRDEDLAAITANASAARTAGIDHVHLPTRSWPFPEEVEAFLETLSGCERPVLVHCEHGEGRSVLMCAMHRIANEGWSNEAAFDGTCRLPDGLRFLNGWFPGLRRFNPEHPKGRFVRSYRPAFGSAAGGSAAGGAAERPSPPSSR